MNYVKGLIIRIIKLCMIHDKCFNTSVYTGAIKLVVSGEINYKTRASLTSDGVVALVRPSLYIISENTKI